MNRKKKIIGSIVALFLVAFALVGLSAKSASATPVCDDNRQSISYGTMGWENPTSHGVADDLHGSTQIWYYYCTGDGGANFLDVDKISFNMVFTTGPGEPWSGNCGTIGTIRVNPEQFGTNLWDPVTQDLPCDGTYKNFQWDAPANTRVYANSSTEIKCLEATWGFIEDPQFGTGAYPDASSPLCINP